MTKREHGGGDCRMVAAPNLGKDFRGRSAGKTEVIFTRGQRNFLGARRVFVAFEHRHLWRTNHLPGTQEKHRIFRALLGSYASHRRQVSRAYFLVAFLNGWWYAAIVIHYSLCLTA